MKYIHQLTYGRPDAETIIHEYRDQIVDDFQLMLNTFVTEKSPLVIAPVTMSPVKGKPELEDYLVNEGPNETLCFWARDGRGHEIMFSLPLQRRMEMINGVFKTCSEAGDDSPAALFTLAFSLLIVHRTSDRQLYQLKSDASDTGVIDNAKEWLCLLLDEEAVLPTWMDQGRTLLKLLSSLEDEESEFQLI